MAYFRVANLTKSYNITREKKQEVLKGVTVEFERGEFVAILGESGCGKSTFLNIAAGLDYDYLGSLVLKGAFMKDFDEHEMDEYRKKQVGIIFQSYNLINHMSVLDNVVIAMSMSSVPKEQAKTRAEELLSDLGIIEHKDKLPTQLSGGQKQRVAIARALANNPTIILADEPTGNLDKEAAEDILNILKEIAVSGKLVICVTHSERVASACTRVLKMDDGVFISDEIQKAYKTAKSNDEKIIKPKPIKTKEVAKISLRNVKQNLKRSLLVSIALSIGIASFVILLALSSGLKSFISNELTSSMNKLQIDVTKDATATNTFSSSDIKLLETLEGADRIIKSSSAYLTANYKTSQEGKENIISALSATFEGFSPTLSRGEIPLSDNEILISASMFNKIFGTLSVDDSTVFSKTLYITIDKTQTFTVSGVISDTSVYDTAYITENALKNLYSNNTLPTNKVYVMASGVEYVSALVSDIELLGFTATRQDTSVEDMLSYVDIGTFVLAGISAISLVVSAIMIFIVMYISVVERTKEIGILRAIGSRRSDVKKMFVFEAGIIGLIAGIIGAFIALFIGVIANLALSSSYSTNFFSYNPLYYLLGIFISGVLSVLASLGPSSFAAAADPVESLRAE